MRQALAEERAAEAEAWREVGSRWELARQVRGGAEDEEEEVAVVDEGVYPLALLWLHRPRSGRQVLVG